MIATRQEGDSWGKSVIEHLSEDLQAEFPGIKGFSVRNLWNMRSFFISYCDDEKLQPLAAEIGWTHNLVILERCKDPKQREFYILMTKKFGWTKNVLIPQIENSIRFLLESRGLTVINVGNDFTHKEKNLNDLFRDYREEIIGIFESEDFVYALESFLCLKEGQNFRNELSHGLIQHPQDYRLAASWWLTLYLIFIFKYTD